jgi:uncharacterized delta-60 repeat protein
LTSILLTVIIRLTWQRRWRMGKLLVVQTVVLVSVLLLVGCGGGGGGGGAAPSWAASYGGSTNDNDCATSIQQTSDGGYIVAGYTASFGAGNSDFWVLKLNSGGAVSWQKSYGGAEADSANSIQQTGDGGYIVAGYTYSFGAGNSDFWVLKLDSNGTVDWERRYGGAEADSATSIQQTSDGYIVAGATYSFGAGNMDFWVLKLNSSGTPSWAKTYGGASGDGAYSIQQTDDLGYILAGYTYSFGGGDSDFWVLKLDTDGVVSWQKTYSGGDDDIAYSIQQTSDDGYVVTGYTKSFGAGNWDFWVLKLNSYGTVDWQKAYGGTEEDLAKSIQETSDGGYIVAGYTLSFGAGSYDFWVLKLNSYGTVDWQKGYGGAGWDQAQSIRQTIDGRYIAAGWTGSFVITNWDFWVLKLNGDGTVPFNAATGAQAADTDAVPADTTASVVDTGVAGVLVPLVSATTTNATVVDTDATVMRQAP